MSAGYKALVALILAALIGAGIAWYGHVKYDDGHDAAVATRTAQDAAKLLADTKTQAAKDAAAKAVQDAHNLADIAEKAAYEKRIQTLIAAGRAGAVVLRVPTDGVCTAGKAEPATAAGEPGATPGQQLMPSTTGDILGVARDITNGVRDYNALIDAYGLLRKECTSNQ